jgi:hypothetical protein
VSAPKGIDDLLAGGGQPRRLRGNEVAAFFADHRTRLFGHLATPADPPPATPTRPPFPLDVFPERVARFVRRVAAAKGSPVDFVAVAVLVVAGAAVGAARCIQIKRGWTEKPGMYAAIVAPTGAVKSPALRAVMAPVYEEQERLWAGYRAARRKYREDAETYERAIRTADQDDAGAAPPAELTRPTEPPPLQHLFVSDITVEELANNLKDSPKGVLLFRDELTAWVRSMDQYRARGSDRQFFLSAWSGEMVKVDRKGQHGEPVIIPHPFIRVLGGLQPDLLPELEAEGGREDGFAHRILFAYPPDAEFPGWIADEITEDDTLDWGLVLARLLKLQPSQPEGGSERPRVVPFRPNAQLAFAVWCNTLAAETRRDDFPPEMLGVCSKLRAYAARFALVLHLLRFACRKVGDDQDEGAVDEEDVGGAVKLCAYFRAHARSVSLRLRQTRDDRAVELLVGWMTRKTITTATVRDVCRANVAGVAKRSDAERLFRAAADRHLGEAGGNVEGGKRASRVDWFRLADRTPDSQSPKPPDKPDSTASTP